MTRLQVLAAALATGPFEHSTNSKSTNHVRSDMYTIATYRRIHSARRFSGEVRLRNQEYRNHSVPIRTFYSSDDTPDAMVVRQVKWLLKQFKDGRRRYTPEEKAALESFLLRLKMGLV